jgi:hypothetical protein
MYSRHTTTLFQTNLFFLLSSQPQDLELDSITDPVEKEMRLTELNVRNSVLNICKTGIVQVHFTHTLKKEQIFRGR